MAPNGGGDAHGVRVGRGRRVWGRGAPLVCNVGHHRVIDRSVLFIMQDAGCATRAMHGNSGRWCPRGRVVPWGCPWVGKTVGAPIRARLRTKQASCLPTVLPDCMCAVAMCNARQAQQRRPVVLPRAGWCRGDVRGWARPLVVPYGPAYVPSKRPVSVLSPV